MNTKKLSFNDWMDHIANQLQQDYRKLYYSSKYQNDKKKSKDFCRLKIKH